MQLLTCTLAVVPTGMMVKAISPDLRRATDLSAWGAVCCWPRQHGAVTDLNCGFFLGRLGLHHGRHSLDAKVRYGRDLI